MTSQEKAPNAKVVYDLEERTPLFGERVIEFVKTLPRSEVNRVLTGQLVESATSIGANYMEADAAESKKDFRHKIALCKKESQETLHWFRMVAKANPARAEECRLLWSEAHEFVLIFSSILRSGRVHEEQTAR